jgi:hypothetical protein
MLISKNCAQLKVLQMQIPRKYLKFPQFIFYFKNVIGTIEDVEFGTRRLLVALLWCPRFLISVINANDRINWVKPADVGQTMVNLGHHLENLVNNHYWPPN